MPKLNPGLTAVRPIPTIVCINRATKKLGVDFDRLIAALQKYLDEHFVPVWGTPAKLEKGKKRRDRTWTLIFLDDQDSDIAKREGWVGLHHLEGDPVAKVFVRSVLKSREKVSVAASHELAEMLVDPGINLWCMGPDGVLYAYEVCDAVEEVEFLVDGIPMCNFVYPSYFDLSRKPGSVKFDHRGKLSRPFQLLPKGYASVLRIGKKDEIFGSPTKEKHFAKEKRAGHRSERRGELMAIR
jgi:hypothetical protein